MKLITFLIYLSSILFSATCYAKDLTQSDVDKIIKTAPIIVEWFENNKGTLSKSAIKIVGDGTFDGNLHQAFGKIVVNDDTASAFFESTAISNGFKSYQEFAQLADRAYSLLAVNTMMSVSASFGKDEKVENVFEYLKLDSTPADEKTKLEGYLPDMYERLNADPMDLPIVLKNFDSLKAELIR